jgi:comEA protein
MLSLTYQERRVLLIIGSILLLGAVLKISKTSFLRKELEPRVVTYQRVNINTATQEELEQLPWIGAKIARRILDYRSKNGKFKNWEELLNIKGIGPKRLKVIREYIAF